MTYRDKDKLSYDMLSVLKDGPQQRTNIMRYGETSYKVYRKRFVEWLEKGLIEEMDDFDRSVQLTKKGRKFVEAYECMNGF